MNSYIESSDHDLGMYLSDKSGRDFANGRLIGAFDDREKYELSCGDNMHETLNKRSLLVGLRFLVRIKQPRSDEIVNVESRPPLDIIGNLLFLFASRF
jgi:hypothetical protein